MVRLDLYFKALMDITNINLPSQHPVTSNKPQECYYSVLEGKNYGNSQKV
jgi:hypothetical protein